MKTTPALLVRTAVAGLLLSAIAPRARRFAGGPSRCSKDAPRHPLLDRGRDAARALGDTAARRPDPGLLRPDGRARTRHGRADAAARARADHGHDRPELGRELLGHRRLLRPRGARGQGRLPRRLRVRRGGADERQAVRGDRAPRPQRLVAPDAALARRDPAPRARRRRAGADPPVRGRREGHPFKGDEPEGDARIWDVSPLVGVPGRPRERPGLPRTEPRRDRPGALGAREEPLHHGRRRSRRCIPTGAERRPLLQVPAGGRGAGGGGRLPGRRGADVRQGPGGRPRLGRRRASCRSRSTPSRRASTGTTGSTSTRCVARAVLWAARRESDVRVRSFEASARGRARSCSRHAAPRPVEIEVARDERVRAARSASPALRRELGAGDNDAADPRDRARAAVGLPRRPADRRRDRARRGDGRHARLGRGELRRPARGHP